MAGICTKCDRPAKGKGLCSRHYNAAYYQANAERLRAVAREWSRKNPERLKANNAARDPARLRVASRDYYQRNRLACIARFANDRAARLGIPGVLTAESLAARIAYFNGRCWVCGGDGNTIDHVKPLGKRGPNIPANIRPACGSCNSAKSWEGRR